jgi:hypothetical protein
MKGRELAQALGWFSIGLGATELLLGGKLTKALGMGKSADPIVRGFGLREIANGIYILARPDDAKGLWARVAGDVVDLTSLWSGFALPSNPHRGRVVMAMGAVAGVTVLDIACARQLSNGFDESWETD